MTIGLETPNGKFHIHCTATIEDGTNLRIRLSGPLGVDLALIEMRGERYVMKNAQQGATIEGYSDEALNIPSLNVDLPPLNLLALMLIPYPNIIYPQEWEISDAIIGANGELSLKPQINSGIERLHLRLDFSPLKVLHETSAMPGAPDLSRTFIYDDEKSYLPSAINVIFGELILNITYKTLTINRSASSQLRSTPL